MDQKYIILVFLYIVVGFASRRISQVSNFCGVREK